MTGPRRPLSRAAGARARKRAIVQARALVPCDHDWDYREDWEGDPGVIGGTYTICWMECCQCGQTRSASTADRPQYDYADEGDYSPDDVDLPW